MKLYNSKIRNMRLLTYTCLTNSLSTQIVLVTNTYHCKQRELTYRKGCYSFLKDTNMR